MQEYLDNNRIEVNVREGVEKLFEDINWNFIQEEIVDKGKLQ